jgi:hypothetical protein
MGTLTSANAVVTLAISNLFTTPQQLQQFSADDIFSTDPIDSAITEMGVDGVMSGGFVFVPIKMSISLMANSPSCAIFDQWWAANQLAQDAYYVANGVVILKSIGTKWTLTNGFLTSFQTMPDAGKTLKMRKMGITWNAVSPAATS